MTTIRSTTALLLLLALLLPAAAVRAEEAPADGEATSPTPELAEVEAGPFRATLALGGTFVPRESHEVGYEPDRYKGALEVERAVSAGRVTKGQTLVSFDREAINEQIEKARRGLALAEIALARAEEEMRRDEEQTRLRLHQAEIQLQRKRQERQLWLEVNRPMRIEQSELGVEGMEHRVGDQEEEIEQLEKMYEADDLTEETEEIVLRRARRSLERLRKSLGFTRKRHEMLVEVEIPREDEDQELAVRREESEFEKLKVVTELALRKQRLELEGRRESVEEEREALEELLADREALDVTAPADGMAVPGFFRGTKWQKVDETARALVPGETAPAGRPLYTIFRPGNVEIVGQVAQGDLLSIEVGASVRVRPAIASEKVLAGRVHSVAPVPEGDKHEVRIRLSETHEALVPGQDAKVEILVAERAAALTVPEGAVKRGDDGAHVWLWVDGEAQRTKVEVGYTSDGRTEILDGLEEGDRVLASPPKSS